MQHKRWKLITLCIAAVVMAIVAAGAIVYYAARAAVEESVQEFGGWQPHARFEPEIRFVQTRFSSESLVAFEFEVDLNVDFVDPRYNPVFNTWIYEWGLRKWDFTRKYPRYGKP